MATPPATSVLRIDIVASWGGLGPAQYEHTVIQRTGNTFAIDDQTVDADKIEALLTALFTEPQRAPSPTLIEDQAQQYDVDYFVNVGLRQCAGDGADLSEPRTLFKSLFYEDKNQRKWLGDEYSARTFHTDDYPTEQITVTFENGSTVRASSHSQKILMLPFDVARNGKSYATFDDRIPRAVATLTVGGVNSERLDGSASLFSAYSDWLCEAFQDQISLAVIMAWAPRIAQFITSERIVTDDFRVSEDLSSIYGRLWFAEWPKSVTYQVSLKSSPPNPAALTKLGLRVLRETKERGDSITSLPWVRRWFEKTQHPKMLLEVFCWWVKLPRLADYRRRFENPFSRSLQRASSPSSFCRQRHDVGRRWERRAAQCLVLTQRPCHRFGSRRVGTRGTMQRRDYWKRPSPPPMRRIA